jgi:hypothetical protein
MSIFTLKERLMGQNVKKKAINGLAAYFISINKSSSALEAFISLQLMTDNFFRKISVPKNLDSS